LTYIKLEHVTYLLMWINDVSRYRVEANSIEYFNFYLLPDL